MVVIYFLQLLLTIICFHTLADTLNNSGNYDLMLFDPYAPRDVTVPFDMPVLSLELPTCLDQSLLSEEYDGICQSDLPLSPMTSPCHTIWTPLCIIEEEALKLIQEILTNLQWTTVVLIHDTASGRCI